MAKAKTQQENNKFAVIKTGGKQYLIKEGEILKIEKLSNVKDGDSVSFDEVLLTGDGENAKIGNPTVSGAKVNVSIVEMGRDQKIVVIKYKQKSRYYKKNGHRQPYTKVKIESIKA